jgi:chromosome segregation ATPase
MPEITPATERKLRDAMERLLTGTAVRTDGRIIKENLYREAGVSRATMNRAKAVMDEWSRRVDGTQPRDHEIESLKQSLAERSTQLKEIRARVHELEDQLTIATTAIAELHAENQLLRGEDPTRNVTPMRRSPVGTGAL